MANVGTTAKARLRDAQVTDLQGPSLDVATLVGVLGAFAIIAAAMILGGSPESFVDLPALLIVFGGTFLVTTASHTMADVWGTQSVAWRAIVYNVEDPSGAARKILHLADRARHAGPLALLEIGRNISRNPFLNQAIQLVADGMPVEEIEQILTNERVATHERHLRSTSVLRRAGEVAPAMGLIGTLVGLVQMLGNLNDPSTIGPSMAVALLTTFYGAILANMLFNPVASKLERNSEVESMVQQIYTMGAASISRQENPRRLEVRINTLLSPAQRVNFFD